MKRVERYYTIRIPLEKCVENDLHKKDENKQVEVSVITNAKTDEDKVIGDIIKGLGSFFYTAEKESEFLAELERGLWDGVDDDVENLKTCIVGDGK